MAAKLKLVHGGKRKGSGRPKGSGKYGSTTKAIRVPELLINEVYTFIENNANKYPLFSSNVSAGYPVVADDHVDRSMSLDDYLIPNPTSTFFIKVDGESMRDAGIFSGDIVVVDRSIEPKSKKIVVASVDGGLTVKRFIKESSGVVLMPENDEFKPIWFKDGKDLHVWGVVVGVIKKFG